MPVHPEAQQLLAALSAAGLPPFEHMTVPQARAATKGFIDLQGEPEDVAVQTRAAPGPGGQIPVRIYTPAGEGPLPVVVYFHGGGWVIGDLDTVDTPLRSLANRAGAIVCSVDYRLAPEHRYPAAFDDAYAATVWAAREAPRFGGDPDRLAVAGDSAGGNLAAAVAIACRDRLGPSILAQLLIYPVTDFGFSTASYERNGEGYLLTRGSMQWFWAHYLGAQDLGKDPYACPARSDDLVGLPRRSSPPASTTRCTTRGRPTRTSCATPVWTSPRSATTACCTASSGPSVRPRAAPRSSTTSPRPSAPPRGRDHDGADGSHLYWFSFDAQPDWSRVYAFQPEIQANIERLVDRMDLRRHIRLNTEVTGAHWDDASGCWTIGTAGGEPIRARFLVTAWGQLNRPTFRDIPGRADFTGPYFHSARWDHDVDLAGKRVACIGNGASAVQFIPEIAPIVSELTVFARHANYVVPRDDRPYESQERQDFLDQPDLLQASRDAIYWEHEGWMGAMKQGTPVAEEFTAAARAHLEATVTDPELREKLWPDYPIGCKRIIADTFYPAMIRDNVHLVTDKIEGVEPAGVRTSDGTLHEVDVIIYATGFETLSFNASLDVTGRGGLVLRDAWREGPQAYLGMSVAGFPNLYRLYGPNTNLGHNSIIAMLECQYGYVLQGLQVADEKDAALDLRRDVQERFNAELQAELADSSFAGSCNSWYKTADGKITNNWMGSVEDYRQATARLDVTEQEDMLGPLIVDGGGHRGLAVAGRRDCHGGRRDDEPEAVGGVHPAAAVDRCGRRLRRRVRAPRAGAQGLRGRDGLCALVGDRHRADRAGRSGVPGRVAEPGQDRRGAARDRRGGAAEPGRGALRRHGGRR